MIPSGETDLVWIGQWGHPRRMLASVGFLGYASYTLAEDSVGQLPTVIDSA